MGRGIDHSDHTVVTEALRKAQNDDTDNRDATREAHLFVDKRDGQWEPSVLSSHGNKPRYTFDQVNPIIDQIAGEMEKADFGLKVRPAGGEATKDVALTYDGMIRNIENISDASTTFDGAGRYMTTGGMSGWRVVQKFVDSDSFDQDLLIEPIANYVDRVWFGYHEKQDASDAECAWILSGLTPADYKQRFPNGQAMSVQSDRSFSAYFNRSELIMVGEYLYIQETPRELVKMSNNKVYAVDDEFNRVRDELALADIVEIDRRTRKQRIVHSRLFDAATWLKPSRPTVFEWLPVIPCYVNFKVIENKIIYWGVVEKLLDSQRVFNYATSRRIEEGALAPRDKYWMTEKQQAGHEDELATMNTNPNPVQTYNHDSDVPGPPQQQGGATINPGLVEIGNTMRESIGHTAGQFAANMGDNPGLQSGVAISKLQDRATVGTVKYFNARKVAQAHTGRILINAIPKVYQPGRQVRIIAEDGEFNMVTIGQEVTDRQTSQISVLHDLAEGTYDLKVSAGPNYANRQLETVDTIVKVAQVDPSIIELGGDILLKNVAAPGMDQIAARKREQLLLAGAIPEDQMTDEEMEMLIAMQQRQQNSQQSDAATMIGEAELIKAQNEQARTVVDVQDKRAKIQLAAVREIREARLARSRIAVDQARTSEHIEQGSFDRIVTMMREQQAQTVAMFETLKTQADTLKAIREGMGAETIVGPTVVDAFRQQAGILVDSQEQAQ